MERGAIEGVVRLAAGAEVPVEGGITGPTQWPEACPPPSEADTRPIAVDESRGLAGVLVSASEFAGTAPATEPRVHRVVLRNCRLGPRFLVATRGDRLEVRNETNHPFFAAFSAGGGGINQALLHEQVREFDLGRGGVHEVACTFGSPCGRTQVAVLYHPVHALTAAGGRFRIERAPVGAMEIHAWHPVLRDAMQRITVQAGQTTRVELEVQPAPAPPPPTPPGPPDPTGPF
jgi:hypothetical protein